MPCSIIRAAFVLILTPLLTLGGSVAHAQQGVTVQVPAAVQATITAEVGNGQVTEISREQEEGKTTYNIGALIDSTEYEMHIREDGLLLHKHQAIEGEEDGAKRRTTETLPPAVRDALQKAAGGAAVEQVEERPQSFTTQVIIAGHRYRITVDAQGKLIEKEYEGEPEGGGGEED